MTKEQTAFVQILFDYLNGRKTEEMTDLDWNIMLKYARSHQVTGIIYTQVKKRISHDVVNIFRRETLDAFCHYSIREELCGIIQNAFTEKGIPYFIIKGPAVAELYPDPSLRVMGDIDIVVHAKDRELCHEIMLEKGFTSFSKYEGREWQYFKNNIEFELHDRLVYQETINEKGQDLFFNDCWKYVQSGQLDWSFHLLFLIFHLRKHLMNSGAGFRHFMDLAVVARKGNIDWDWMAKNLETTGMLKFGKKCFGLIDCWFGIHTLIAEKVNPEFYDMATAKTFEDGIFGFDNSENDDSDVINMIRKKNNAILGKVQIALGQVFPSGRILKTTKTYSYLERFPFLLPFAWIHRGARCVIGKKNKVFLNSIEKTFITNDIVNKREEIYQKWGL